MASNNIPEYLGNQARLIPIAKKTEARILSSTLAALGSVHKFAEDLLGSIGKKIGKHSKIECYTEVTFKSKYGTVKPANELRPDGLIIVTVGSRKWLALVEAKITNATLKQKQIESYLDLAKKHGIDAVITISNQFAITPKHRPYTVSKGKLNKVPLYHWSWAYIATRANILVNTKKVIDPAQAYILSELVRFFKHERSGIISYTNMGASWRNACEAFQNRTRINDKEARDCVESWHQFARANAISLGLEIGVDVDVKPQTREHRADHAKHIADDAANLISDKELVANLSIPGATPTIKLKVFMDSSLMTVSMRIKTPQKMGSEGSITWLLDQLKEAIDNKYYAKVRDNSSVLAIWSEKKHSEAAPLKKILQKERLHLLINDNKSITPKFFEIQLKKRIPSQKFSNPKFFVEEAEPLLQVLYTGVGKNLMPKQKERTLKAKTTKKTTKMSKTNKSVVPVATEVAAHNLGAPSGSKPDGGQ